MVRFVTVPFDDDADDIDSDDVDDIDSDDVDDIDSDEVGDVEDVTDDDEIDNVDVDNGNDEDNDTQFACAPEDIDDYIGKRMDKFRFQVGDKVIVNTEDGLPPCNDGWVRGHIIEVNKYFGYYTCE